MSELYRSILSAHIQTNATKPIGQVDNEPKHTAKLTAAVMISRRRNRFLHLVYNNPT